MGRWPVDGGGGNKTRCKQACCNVLVLTVSWLSFHEWQQQIPIRVQTLWFGWAVDSVCWLYVASMGEWYVPTYTKPELHSYHFYSLVLHPLPFGHIKRNCLPEVMMMIITISWSWVTAKGESYTLKRRKWYDFLPIISQQHIPNVSWWRLLEWMWSMNGTVQSLANKWRTVFYSSG